MKDKLKQEIIDWYKEKNNESEPHLEEFIDFVIEKTSDALMEEIKNELNQEFKEGNLNQPLTISNEYYLHLKFTDIKNKCFNLNLPRPTEEFKEIND